MGYRKLYLAPMLRPLALAALVLAFGAGSAHAATQRFRVVIVPDLAPADLQALAAQGAVGLLVPANGPSTSSAQARSALERGEVRNSLLNGGVPGGPPLISVQTAADPPTAGPAIVVELPQGGEQPNDHRFPIVVLGHGFHGLLTSPSTRLPGVVSIVDIAPTALGEDDGLGWQASDNAAARVAELDTLIREKKDTRLASALLVAVLALLLAFTFPRAALLAYATALTTNVVLGATETTTLWVVLLVIAAAMATAIPFAVFVRGPTWLGLVLAAALAIYLASMAYDAEWIAYSPWGPGQAGRFYGVTNLLETMLLVPALAGAALVGRRFGAAGFAAVALLAFVTVAGSRFGADGGGAVVLAAGYLLLAVLLANLRGRRLAAAVGATVAVSGGLIALDAATGGSSHVTRAAGGGPGEVVDRLRDRLAISWDRATLGPGPALATFVSVGVLAALVIWLARADTPLPERALPLALAVAVAVSLLVNDAPSDVATAGLVGFVVCALVMLRSRCAAASCLRSPLAFSWPAAAVRRPSHLPPRP
jgi:hypothetical protein